MPVGYNEPMRQYLIDHETDDEGAYLLDDLAPFERIIQDWEIEASPQDEEDLNDFLYHVDDDFEFKSQARITGWIGSSADSRQPIILENISWIEYMGDCLKVLDGEVGESGPYMLNWFLYKVYSEDAPEYYILDIPDGR